MSAARYRAGNRRPDDELGRELDRVGALKADRARYGAQYHILIGMEWALKWASHRGASPSTIVQSLTEADSARELASAYDALTHQIEATMTSDEVAALFGEGSVGQ